MNRNQLSQQIDQQTELSSNCSCSHSQRSNTEMLPVDNQSIYQNWIIIIILTTTCSRQLQINANKYL